LIAVADFGGSAHTWVSASGWAAVLLLAVFCTAIAYMLYAHALSLAPASRLAAIQTIEPLIAVVLAALILGEVLTPALTIGGAAILLGIYLVERNTAGEGGCEKRKRVNCVYLFFNSVSITRSMKRIPFA
jgi:drug/metabolite transporter (DMT)-like permease